MNTRLLEDLVRVGGPRTGILAPPRSSGLCGSEGHDPISNMSRRTIAASCFRTTSGTGSSSNIGWTRGPPASPAGCPSARSACSSSSGTTRMEPYRSASTTTSGRTPCWSTSSMTAWLPIPTSSRSSGCCGATRRARVRQSWSRPRPLPVRDMGVDDRSRVKTTATLDPWTYGCIVIECEEGPRIGSATQGRRGNRPTRNHRHPRPRRS